MFIRVNAVMVAGWVLLAADPLPNFSVEPFCRAVARRAAPVGDLDNCMRKEMEAKDQLAKEWSQFAAADKSYCLQLSTIGGDPTYTELLTCLELQRDARRLREREQETIGHRPRQSTHRPEGLVP
jgi:hypothetical protein